MTQSRLTKILAYARAHGLKAGLEVAINFLLPFLIYSSLRGAIGDVRALMAASGPPILWSVVEFIRQRKVDAIAILVLTGIALSLLAFAGGGGVKFLQLRENLVTGLVGLIFLGSAAIGKPLIYQLARAGTRRAAPDRVAAFEALRTDPGFRRALTITTLAWAVGLLAASGLNCVLVFVVSIKLFMLISGPISYATIGLLTAWTIWYVPREKNLAEARAEAAERPRGPPERPI
ncbi:VC0807 family protein [Phenylobacterium sp.]|uniref:VC0807 family protein n=1 Tax=Phenylobacterium sp. TaxID=1871053 RepID=UPI003566ABB3